MGLPEDSAPYVVFRLDGGRAIGFGHIVRCATIAAELERIGVSALAAVSTDESAAIAESRGLTAVVVGGNPLTLDERDAAALRPLMGDGCEAVMVDTYAAGDGFWSALAELSGELEVPLALLDDRYLFSDGMLDAPMKRPVDLVLSYGFDARRADYERVYDRTLTCILAGPRYAPVRRSFLPLPGDSSRDVRRVLVTSGGTNPGHTLERFCEACFLAAPDAEIDLVVGADAVVDSAVACDERVKESRGLTDLAPLMAHADLAVSAAGSTLYELSRMGIPTVAVPIVENQRGNAKGFEERGCGLTCDFEELASTLEKLIDDKELRSNVSQRASLLVDGRGAERTARALKMMTIKTRCDSIVANRRSDEFADVADRVYTRDLFGRD